MSTPDKEKQPCRDCTHYGCECQLTGHDEHNGCDGDYKAFDSCCLVRGTPVCHFERSINSCKKRIKSQYGRTIGPVDLSFLSLLTEIAFLLPVPLLAAVVIGSSICGFRPAWQIVPGCLLAALFLLLGIPWLLYVFINRPRLKKLRQQDDLLVEQESSVQTAAKENQRNKKNTGGGGIFCEFAGEALWRWILVILAFIVFWVVLFVALFLLADQIGHIHQKMP